MKEQRRKITTALGPALLSWWYSLDDRHGGGARPLRAMSVGWENPTINRKLYEWVRLDRRQSLVGRWEGYKHLPAAPEWQGWQASCAYPVSFTGKAYEQLRAVEDALTPRAPLPEGGPSQADDCVTPTEWAEALVAYWETERARQLEKLEEEEARLRCILQELAQAVTALEAAQEMARTGS